MMNQNEKCYIGIDVSKAILDVCILSKKECLQFKNSDTGIQKLLTVLKSCPEAFVAMESTGGYEKQVVQALTKVKIPTAVVNPRQVRDFAKALGKLAKTDRIDAEVIALFAEKIRPEPRAVFNENQHKLVEYNARRRQLVEMVTMEKNRLDKASKGIKKSIQHMIKTLEKELDKINQLLSGMIQSDDEYARRDALLRTIKGVGAIVAVGVIADLPELGKLSAKKISALAGLAPHNRDSGTSRGKRIIWGGRATVRRTLYMATLVVMRYNKKIKDFYTKLCAAGKRKKVAIIACMHKLLIIMNAMIKNDQPWHCEA